MAEDRREFLKRAAGSAAVVTAGFQIAPVGIKAGESATHARVAIHNGVSSLFINDVPEIPYVYFFPVPVKEHIADFAKGGINIYSWGWGSQIPHCLDMGWKGPNQFDYTDFDTQVGTILEANPHAYLIPRLAVSAPERWLEAHPDDRLVTEEGRYPNAAEFCRWTWFLREVGTTTPTSFDSFVEHALCSRKVRGWICAIRAK